MKRNDEKVPNGRVVELGDEDFMLVSGDLRDDPLLVWCHTPKFRRSCCLRDKKSGRTLILVNLKDLNGRCWADKDDETNAWMVRLYLEYALVHEFVHYGSEDTEIPEKVWDHSLAEILTELWSKKTGVCR
jgi:hypothetical protein